MSEQKWTPTRADMPSMKGYDGKIARTWKGGVIVTARRATSEGGGK